MVGSTTVWKYWTPPSSLSFDDSLPHSDSPTLVYKLCNKSSCPLISPSNNSSCSPVSPSQLQFRPKHVELSGTSYTATIRTFTRIPPKSKTKIKIRTKLQTSHVYFEPRTNSVMMNEYEIFFLRGFYSNDNGIVEVWVLNLTDEPKLCPIYIVQFIF